MPTSESPKAAEGRSPRLGDLERAVMNLLWDSDKAMSVRDVQARLEVELAYTTVMTVLDRLGGKEMVERERHGRAYRYRARITREAATAQVLNAALDQAGVDRTSALVHFARSVDAEEAAALRAALADIQHDQTAGPHGP